MWNSLKQFLAFLKTMERISGCSAKITSTERHGQKSASRRNGGRRVWKSDWQRAKNVITIVQSGRL